MTRIKDIIDFTESFAPLVSAMEFDNVGLLVGDKNEAVTKVVVALDITDEVIDEAKENSAELIISHHPVIFDPLKRIEKNSAVYKLIKNDIAALCLHTNLDLSPVFGVNTCLAEAVGVKNCEFVEGECLYIGELEKPALNRSFALTVKEALGCSGLRYTLGNKTVKRVAICSGSGGDLAVLAAEKGADALLTGEIKHHEILDADRTGIAVVDAGHFRTEDIVIEPLCKKLGKEFPDVGFIRSLACTDRVEYC
ncbi:MAG: Nif3-like dinuclear metal center hexameric protein [Ruminococcus sp.]|nr:Nif3-like dinuclear metal center hexameric protein [Ruminococcus sp.]